MTVAGSPWLLVGLGNPGAQYAANRHNIGFMVVDALAKELGAGPFRAKFGGELTEATDRGEKLILLKPQQFMNLSGVATQKASAFYKIAPARTLVVHDEIDLPYERLRLKIGGGHGGHNGLRSLTEHIGPDYLRLRCGVGKPAVSPVAQPRVGDRQHGAGALTAPARDRVVGHVLGDFSKTEQKTLSVFVAEAASAVRRVIEKGPTLAMNEVNRQPTV